MAPIDIFKNECSVKGGIAEIALVWPGDLIANPDYALVPNEEANLVYAPGQRSWKFEQDPFSARLTDKTILGENGGDAFEYTLTATVRGVKLDVEWWRNALKNRRIDVIITLPNGDRRYIPRMRASAESDTGARLSERNGYSVTFRRRMERPAPFLGGTLSNGSLLLDQFGNLVLRAPDNTLWRVTCDPNGVLLTVQVSTGDAVNFYPVAGQNLGVDTTGTLLIY